MAKKLDQFPVSASARYPWDQYLDGSIWELTPEDDFTCSMKSMQGSARAQANRRGGRVRMRTVQRGDGREALVIQFLSPDRSLS